MTSIARFSTGANLLRSGVASISFVDIIVCVFKWRFRTKRIKTTCNCSLEREMKKQVALILPKISLNSCSFSHLTFTYSVCHNFITFLPNHQKYKFVWHKMDDDTTTKDDQYLTDVLSYSVDRLAKVRFLFVCFFSFPFVFTSSSSLSLSFSFLFHFHNRSPNLKRFWR